jgi:energy-converting hydrogenase Eha subunit C
VAHQGIVLAAGICGTTDLFGAISIIIYSRTKNKILALILLSIGV